MTTKKPDKFTWTQVSKVGLTKIIELVDKYPAATKLLLILIREMPVGERGVISMSTEEMADHLKMSIATVNRALKTLTDHGFVRRVKAKQYPLALNPNLSWVGPRKGLHDAMFGKIEKKEKPKIIRVTADIQSDNTTDHLPQVVREPS